jgi:hypothetical protein
LAEPPVITLFVSNVPKLSEILTLMLSFGLAKLTGVRWQKEYDGAWWLDWWEKNSRRLPPEVQAIPIRR